MLAVFGFSIILNLLHVIAVVVIYLASGLQGIEMPLHRTSHKKWWQVFVPELPEDVVEAESTRLFSDLYQFDMK